MAAKTSLESKYLVMPSGCWEWTSPLDTGYGLIRVGPKKQLCAHRYMYELLRGAIPKGLHLDHLCRNPRCVNPDHLEPVTVRVNVRRGKLAKLTVQAVVQIREARASGLQITAVAEQFGLSAPHVSEICLGHYWGDAGGPITPRYMRIKKGATS